MFETGDKVHCKMLGINLIVCCKDETSEKLAYTCIYPFDKDLSRRCKTYSILEKELKPGWVYWSVD